MHARLRGPNNLFILYQLIKKSDFPSLADEIAEARPDMNIKVAAFTVSEKSINTKSLEGETYTFKKSDHFWFRDIQPILDLRYVSFPAVKLSNKMFRCETKKYRI